MRFTTREWTDPGEWIDVNQIIDFSWSDDVYKVGSIMQLRWIGWNNWHTALVTGRYAHMHKVEFDANPDHVRDDVMWVAKKYLNSCSSDMATTLHVSGAGCQEANGGAYERDGSYNSRPMWTFRFIWT